MKRYINKAGWTCFTDGRYDANSQRRLTFSTQDKDQAELAASLAVDWGFSPQGVYTRGNTGGYSVCIYLYDESRTNICRLLYILSNEGALPEDESGQLRNVSFKKPGADDLRLSDFLNFNTGLFILHAEESGQLPLFDGTDDKDSTEEITPPANPVHAQAVSRSNRSRLHKARSSLFGAC